MQPRAGRGSVQAQLAPAQVIEPNLAAGLAAVVREQTRLEREQAQGVAQGAGRGGAAGVPVAMVGAQAAGQVDAQQRAGQVLQALDPIQRRAAHGLRQPQAKQRVDGQVGRIGPFGWRFGPVQASLLRQRPCVACVLGQALRIAQPGHADPAAQRLQTLLPRHGRQQAIAAVVAAAAHHPDPARVRGQRGAQAKHGGTGALHQGVGRQLLAPQCVLRHLLDGAAAVAAIERQCAGQIGQWQALRVGGRVHGLDAATAGVLECWSFADVALWLPFGAAGVVVAVKQSQTGPIGCCVHFSSAQGRCSVVAMRA